MDYQIINYEEMIIFIIVINSLVAAVAHPITDSLILESNKETYQYWSIILNVVIVTTCVCTIFSCVCCWLRKKQDFIEFTHSFSAERTASPDSNSWVENGPRQELTIFPPLGSMPTLRGSANEIQFEPLPDIHPRSCHRKTVQNASLFQVGLSTNSSKRHPDDWFVEPHKNFPRSQLQYVRELGKGWFGYVLEGQAVGINSDFAGPLLSQQDISKETTTVAVKVLREGATVSEQMFFLNEMLMYRDLCHKNILQILSYCLEVEPFLILLEFCSKGTLKGFVSRTDGVPEPLLLQLALDVAVGLEYMHSHNFIHTDLAARNCLVTDHITAKIGDYGNSFDMYKEEYYQVGEMALPLRWCAPETLRCTCTTIETKEVTKAANIWSFGVTLWEVMSRGLLPYENMDDDQVIQDVIISGTCHLPDVKCSIQQDKINDILKLCWLSSRPEMIQIKALLTHLYDASVNTSVNDLEMLDFEERWNQLENKHLLMNHSFLHGSKYDYRFESNFSAGSLHHNEDDLDSKMEAKFGSSVPSWLGLEPGQTLDSLTQEISEAIQRLDEALADEKSELSSIHSSPEKGQLSGGNFKLGKDSFVFNPPEFMKGHTGLSLSGDNLCGFPPLGVDDDCIARLEQGEFSEMIRLKSQSVQDFMKLTVVDDGSDSSKPSQPGSFLLDSNDHSFIQEKTYSSEGNLSEALRDDRFMIELEKLQAEQKYSVISENVREGVPSIESQNLDLAMTIDLQESLVASPINSLVATVELQASSDCVVSSRQAKGEGLPDVVIHNSQVHPQGYVDNGDGCKCDNEYDLSDSCEGKTEDLLTSGNCESDGTFSKCDVIPDIDISHGSFGHKPNTDSFGEILSSENTSSLSDISNIRSYHIQSQVCDDAAYQPENIVEGQNVVIGALEDYSLGLFSVAKSSVVPEKSVLENGMYFCHDASNFSSEGEDWQSEVISKNIENASHSSFMDEDDSESFKSNNNFDAAYGLTKDAYSLSKLGTLSSDPDDIAASVANKINDKLVGVEDHLKDSKVGAEMYSSNEHSLTLFEEENKYFLKNAKSFEESLSDDPYSLNSNNSSKLNDGKSNLVENKSCCPLGSNSESESSESSIDRVRSPGYKEKCLRKQDALLQEGSDSAVENECEENNEFWHQQMTAWQEAALQTRNLLHQAAQSSREMLNSGAGSSEEELDKSDPSTPKSSFSSTDKLNTEDEGTYVSYNTTDDEEILGYKQEDINALRTELSLKLWGVYEPCNKSVEEDDEEECKDDLVINYRCSRSSLSPIKEESLCCDGDLLLQYHNTVAADDAISSVEFVQSVMEKSDPDGGVIMALSSKSTECYSLLTSGMNEEELKSSIVLEDLDGEEHSLQVFGSVTENTSSEDILIVDTVTNEAAIILDNNQPRSHLAFMCGGNSSLPSSTGKVEGSSASRDGTVSCFKSHDNSSKSTDLQPECCLESKSYTENSNYHPYFTSGLNISHPIASLEECHISYNQSNHHTSLPYDVNYQSSSNRTNDERDPLTRLNSLISGIGQIKSELCEGEANTQKLLFDFHPSDSNNSVGAEQCHESEKSQNPPAHLLDMTEKEIDKFHKDEKVREGKVLSDSDSDVDLPLRMEEMGCQEKGETCTISVSPVDQISDDEIIEEIEAESGSDIPLASPAVSSNKLLGMNMFEVCYTPDWESDGLSGESEDDSSHSSISGDFQWTSTLGVIKEEPEEAMEGDESESGEEDFTPSIWNKELTPSRSLLKSPCVRSDEKKNVSWKRERHHRVYEYPPEPQHRSWIDRSDLDFFAVANWDMSDDFKDFRHPVLVDNIDSLIPSYENVLYQPEDNYEIAATLEFPFIGSSSLDLHKDTGGVASSYLEETDDVSLLLESGKGSVAPSENGKPPPVQPVEHSGVSSALGELCHVKNKLRLDLPTFSLEGEASSSACDGEHCTGQKSNDLSDEKISVI